ncbi:MAG TPA: ribosome-associated translation inhibitor RaiA [Deltaproteobacteria bacterium]|jgi:putative sigma-54 modulation protein|nr:ribosome-associated translation inhibitor RaiA [Deltaproteobacteria bacterium]OQC27889.1 MAG: Ribosome-associated factor Y [Deltaproteobacteria bacterium ADurb.Bin072]HRW81140.1 ribosome-associated translation inhibitor RaiA [Desulfomonilia bacterium]NMD40219.1 ribosome-associated translation inhibitor RaiA [Deltaproteobacteria bacterium]HNQ86657.1 ribosome-associated translation inhibitor RaiA [Deltaproteobacteria bacterium]
MQTDITFKNIDSSDALRDYAIKRLSKIDKYIDRTAEAHVVLSVEKRRHKADVTLNADGAVINAVEITEDLYAAIDTVMDKLERQIKKHKEKLQGKKTQPKAAVAAGPVSPAKKARPRLVYERDYTVKPMSVDEALLQMDTIAQDFIIFQNTESQQLNLIYKRQDGELALVEPQI